jgi:glycosyltransferase involved in cell wall biosynthesis
MFAYWGRRGALSQFTLEVARAAIADPRVEATVSVSRQNENFANFAELGPALFAVDTFKTNAGALLQAHRIMQLRHQLYNRLCRDRTQAVIELMPHIWSPLVMPVVGKAGVRYCTIIHDADAHPGDRTSWVKALIDRSVLSADLVLTLSSAVAGRLAATGRLSRDKVITLFHPDLVYGPCLTKEPPAPGGPWRLLFLGRIMPYKGLSLFLDAVDHLRGEGFAVDVGVMGEGALGANAARLARMEAEVVNRWLTPKEIADAFARYHAVVLSHTEASQSGVAAAAFGAGVPVVATPVGGLVEQVIDSITGILALRADAPSLAAAVQRLLEPHVYTATCGNLARSAGERSMARFVSDVVAHAGTEQEEH